MVEIRCRRHSLGRMPGGLDNVGRALCAGAPG